MVKSKKIILNPNITKLKESATLAINMKAKKFRQDGKDVCHFGFGQSPFHVHPKIQIALANNAHQKEYLPTLGLKELRKAISTYYKQFFNFDFSSDHILIGPGSKELIFQALYVLDGPVIVPAPSWVSYGPQVNIRGDRIIPIITKRANSYKLTAKELEETCQKIKTKQKILILNNPSNPTGAVYTDQEIKEICGVCKKKNIIIISDEIYALVNFSGRNFVSPIKYYPEGTILTSGLSKSHAAGGYRLGFLAVPNEMKEVIKCLGAMVSETFSAVSAPIQYAALEAYSGDYELMHYVRQCNKIHKVCAEYLYSRFLKMGLNCPRPEGAFYLFPDFSNYKKQLAKIGIKNCIQLSNYLFDKLLVAILPGADFYFPKSALSCRVATVDYNGESVYQASLSPLLDPSILDFELGFEFVETNCPKLKLGADRIEDFLLDLK